MVTSPPSNYTLPGCVDKKFNGHYRLYLSTIRDEKSINKDGLVFGVSRHFQQYLNFIVAVRVPGENH